ncbi:hypothetical protein HID58_077479 [Brassica napus]|uniref:BnaC07g30980D protein n=2 Tax=Brassica napus TaxID=3708 RepID=A0A078GCP6_BRANA|nr:uncharacterized protein LOC106410385 [Brassica napus]KAH0870457.1 hypothetical protein HID58_077479 [Brassica napus]CAF2017721.1 unnamed protein product [Brassica napus]CDY23089.1 BnaC07g30980D [Brassica napus]
MDLWLIAATAATGYIAKQLQNVTKGKGNFLESSSSEETVKKQESPCRSLLGRLAKKPNENKFGDEEVPSTSGEGSGNYEDVVHSDSSLFGLLPEFLETGHGYWKACGVLGGETELSSSFRQRRFVKRNQRYRRLTKPLSCMESCLMSRFHGEQMTMEDYLTSPFPSPRGSVSRPLLVTDGDRVISKGTADSLWLSQQQQMTLNEDEAAHRNEKSSKSRKHGLSDATVLLQVGVSIGLMASFMARQAEVSKVKQELKKTENVVHDVEGELEMKDSLIVKEVDTEKAAENSESISNIEAELEAELERLEINMVEMEQDLEVEFAQGELIADRVRGKRESNQDPSGNSTPESGNYAVSPRELSLRLHKVINSRLEKRITELETALQESQRKVEQLVMESESKKSSWSRVWEAREVMTYKSDSIAIEHTKTNNNLAEMQPLVMNLTGEALDAFNESYDELMNINDDSEDDDESPLEEMQESELIHHEDFSSTSPWSHHQEDDSKAQEQELLDFIGLEEQDEEISDFESEMEKQLIKQIVEKTKQGSPVVLNAQKMLFLMEESEQKF